MSEIEVSRTTFNGEVRTPRNGSTVLCAIVVNEYTHRNTGGVYGYFYAEVPTDNTLSSQQELGKFDMYLNRCAAMEISARMNEYIDSVDPDVIIKFNDIFRAYSVMSASSLKDRGIPVKVLSEKIAEHWYGYIDGMVNMDVSSYRLFLGDR